jgi:hypothetical protein
MPEKGDNKIESLEKGDIYFFYRPRIEEERPQDISDMRRLYIVCTRMMRISIAFRSVIGSPTRTSHERGGLGVSWGR